MINQYKTDYIYILLDENYLNLSFDMPFLGNSG